MSHIIPQIRKSWRQMTAVAAMLVLTVAAVAVGPGATSVSALGSNCRHYNTDVTFPFTDKGGSHYFTSSTIATTPTNSGCKDINLDNTVDASGKAQQCLSVRVRFILSNGRTKLYRDFHKVCTGQVIASNVKNGARYTLETLSPQRVGVFD